MNHEYPILEFDPDAEAMIEPQRLIKPVEDMPEHCVICFFQDVIEHMREEGLLSEVAAARSEGAAHLARRRSVSGTVSKDFGSL